MTTRTTALVGAAALVGRDLRPVGDAVVIMDGTRIAAVGTTAETPVPPDAERIDASGTTLVPGFIDAHVHIGFYDPRAVLTGGVTTARDLAWPPDRIFTIVEESRRPTFDGPRLIAAGPMITVPGGYPTRAAWAPPGTGLPVTTPDEARAAVDTAATAGASVIKVAMNPLAGPTLPPDLLSAVVDAAHSRGLKVTGHVAGVDQLEIALDAGVDELAHMLMGAERIPDAVIRRMVEAGMAVVPTLSIRFGRERRVAIANLARFLAAGGNVIYGTDLGNTGPRPGIDLREVTGMAKAGMSARDIVAAATVTSAEWLGLDTTGVLGPGMDADIVAIRGALDRPRALTEVAMVWRLGRRAR